MTCGKAKAIQEAFNSNGNICQMENEAAKEYTHSMKELKFTISFFIFIPPLVYLTYC